MNRMGKSNKFLITTFFGGLVLIGLVALINIYIDVYGLFSDSGEKGRQVLHNEMVTKYNFSLNYIPSNFNGVLIGPSLSDNLDVSRLSGDGIKYYNASVMGANISELRIILNNVIENGEVKSVIVCLHPYLTQTYGNKGIKLGKDLYYEAFGSLNLYQTYTIGLMRMWDLLPHKFPKDQFAIYGTNNYNSLFRVSDIEAKIKEEAGIHREEEIVVDDRAVDELEQLFTALRKEGIKVYGYFHPQPELILQSNRQEYQNYQSRILSLFSDPKRVLDFNHPDYTSFRSDVENYIDHGHLSRKGSQFLEDKLKVELLNQ